MLVSSFHLSTASALSSPRLVFLSSIAGAGSWLCDEWLLNFYQDLTMRTVLSSLCFMTLTLALVTLTLALADDTPCPQRCLCFKSTVRCMFLQLEIVPPVPVETTILDLRFNKIKEISQETFGSLKELNTLLLNNNHITKISAHSFRGLPSLRYLYLYKNRIREIEQDAFKGLHKLEQLYIHFNKIEQIESETFDDLPALERLFLHNNNLSRIPRGAFKKLTSLRRLRLDSNALICDCQLMWLSQMLKRNRGTTQSAATCGYPRELHGKSLMALDSKDFQCKIPKLTEEPNDVDISFGGTAYFTCKADGDPKPDIVWLHNSNEIEPDGHYNVLTDGTLMITEAQDLDEGVYECMAKNTAGETKSRPAKMHYFESKGKLSFVEQPEDTKVILGSTVILPCRARGEPPPAISWTHNDLAIPHSPRYHVSSSGALNIKNVQKQDSGLYQCFASNLVSHISTTVNLQVQAPPTFLERPRDQEAIEGNPAELLCVVEGFPQPKLSWTKDEEPIKPNIRFSIKGSSFKIKRVRKSDEGIYVCHAENEAGQRNSSALLMVRERGPPVFTSIPENQKIAVGSSVELPCYAIGQPLPVIRWKKDGHFLGNEDNRHRITPHGVLYMFDMKQEDEGIYQCIAENDVGQASVSIHLSIGDSPLPRYPGNRYVITAIDEAKTEVEKALNHTLDQLFGEPHKRSPGELMQVFRFPSDEARNLARAAEIHERALEIVWSHVQSGAQFNLTEFSYQHILSPNHLRLLANLSGCLMHRQHIPCNDICFHQRYRTLDGTCNNRNNPLLGSSLTPFARLLPSVYENGFNTPIGWSKTQYNGFELPSARLVSTSVISTNTISEDGKFSHMLMQWGQFLDHDMDFSMPSISHASFVDGIDCATSCEYAPPCFPIEVPQPDPRIGNHRCMEFTRSSTVCGSGMTSIFFNQIQPREQANQLTSYIDASNVYGSNDQVGRHLRNFTSDRGLLRSGILMRTGKALLPFNDGQPIDCKRDFAESNVDCFLAGDVRANEQLGLLAMHTLWMREHNRLATELSTINPHWDGDKLYHEARKLVGAVMQHITYTHWLPKVLGEKGMTMLEQYEKYDPDVDPSISNVFATAALRFGHTLINPELMRLNESYQPIPQGHIPLRKAFFSPFRLVEEGGLDPLMRGLIVANTKLRKPDQLLNSELTEHLFTPAHLVAQDLAALNIQRGRDHALPRYNKWRKYCNLTEAKTFDDLKREITDSDLLKKLEILYGHPDNIDIWVGGISEEPVDNAKVGPTFRCLLVDQFRRVRAGDRFWYENPGIFTQEQLHQIKRSSLGRVLCDNGDNITKVTKDVFLVPEAQDPNFVHCNSVAKMELNLWTECCQECNAKESNELARLHYRSKRSTKQNLEPLSKAHPTELANCSSNNNSNSDLWLTTLSKYEKDFDATEQRIEGIEELVGRLEKTVKKLSRKVKKLEAECKLKTIDGCIDINGKHMKSGEKWNTDNCTKCQCEENRVTCWVETCPPLSCKNSKISPNSCCPVC